MDILNNHIQITRMAIQGRSRLIFYIQLGFHPIEDEIPTRELGKHFNDLPFMSKLKARNFKSAVYFLSLTKKGLEIPRTLGILCLELQHEWQVLKCLSSSCTGIISSI